MFKVQTKQLAVHTWLSTFLTLWIPYKIEDIRCESAAFVSETHT